MTVSDYQKQQCEKAQAYISRIRNPTKRQYAIAFYGWLLGALEHKPEPARLARMEAQSVRMTLVEFGLRKANYAVARGHFAKKSRK